MEEDSGNGHVTFSQREPDAHSPVFQPRRREPEDDVCLTVSSLGDLEIQSVEECVEASRAPSTGLLRVSNDDLQEAALRCDLRGVRALIQAGASVNAPMRAECSDDFITLLHVLASKPQIPNGEAVMAEICKSKANLNSRSTLGSTPLMHACQKKNIRAAEVLLKSGADWQPVDDAGMTSLQYAVSLEEGTESESVALLELMSTSGVGLNHGGKNSAVTEAILERNLAGLQTLLELGAEPDGINEAVAVAPIEFIKPLIEAEVNPFHRDQDHKNAMDLAITRGDNEVTTMMRDYVGWLQRQRHAHLQTMEDEPEPFPSLDDERGGGERTSLLRRSIESGRTKVLKKSWPEWLIGAERLELGRNISEFLVEQAIYEYVTLLVALIAIYLPDLWVVAFLDEDLVIDIMLGLIAAFFGLDGIIQALAYESLYIGKFFFFVDIIGFASVILDFSFIRQSVRESNDSLYGASSPAKAATRRFVVLLVRTGQLLKLLKLLRHLPARRRAQAAKGTAKSMSLACGAMLSARAATLIVTMSLLVPLIEVSTYPAVDWSMRMWVEELEWRARHSPQLLESKRAELLDFYKDERHFPIEAFISDGQTSWIWDLSNKDPDFEMDRVRITSPLGPSYIVFNFEDVVKWTSISNLLLISALIVISLFASWLMQRSVTTVLFLPLDGLLRGVRHTARNIIKSVTSMAGKMSDEPPLPNRGVHSSDTVGREVTLGDEMELLKKVLTKLQVLSELTKKPEENTEDDFDGHYRAVLAEYAHEVPIHSMTAVGMARALDGEDTSSHLIGSFASFSEIKGSVEEVMECRLFDAGMAYDSLLTFQFDVLQLTDAQSQELCKGFLEFYRPPGQGGVNIDLKNAYANFLVALRSKYKSRAEVPYHNFQHGLDVACMVFRLLHICSASAIFGTRDLFALMVASLGHDVGHPGVNNPFLVETQHELAIRYNDQSPLESMHCATLFEIAADPDKHIFGGLDRQDYRHLRHTIVEAILNTDAHTHFARIKELKFIYESSQEAFDRCHQKYKTAHTQKPEFPAPEVQDIFSRTEVTRQMRNLFLYFADISNPMRPWENCRLWALMITEEFARQGDQELALGLPVQGLHDRNNINMAYSQIGFIEYFTAPLAFVAARLLPPIDICDEMLVTNANFWYEEWVETTDPPPTSGERAKVKERIQRLEGRCP